MKDESGTILKKCPKCETDDELSIDSCGSLCRSEFIALFYEGVKNVNNSNASTY
jgi:hypothetical protein